MVANYRRSGVDEEGHGVTSISRARECTGRTLLAKSDEMRKKGRETVLSHIWLKGKKKAKKDHCLGTYPQVRKGEEGREAAKKQETRAVWRCCVT